MAQSVKHPTLDFGSGRDLMVGEIEPQSSHCADSAESAWDSLLLSLCLSLAHVLAHSLKLKKKNSKWKVCHTFSGFHECGQVLGEISVGTIRNTVHNVGIFARIDPCRD